MPSSRQVRMTRTAISPRLATRIRFRVRPDMRAMYHGVDAARRLHGLTGGPEGRLLPGPAVRRRPGAGTDRAAARQPVARRRSLVVDAGAPPGPGRARRAPGRRAAGRP